MKWDNPVAITKHPKGTATFCVRLCTAKGTRYQTMLEKPKSIEEMLSTLEEQIASIRKYFLEAYDAPQVRNAVDPQV